MAHHFRVVADLPFLGRREIVELRLEGFRDDDGDLRPEFDIDLEVFDVDVVPARFRAIELDLSLVGEALSGGVDGAEKLFAHVVDVLKAKGVDLPF